ncbi:MAG: hypothetical protein PVG83_02825 [Acidimicrobiia bacterium]
MTDGPQDDFEFPTRRWLVWGVVAIVVLAGVILTINWLTGDDDPESATTAEQMEWSIVLTDLTGDTVTLKGDLPFGFPTETWQNDFQVARAVNGDFEWDLDLELPIDVVAVDQASDCEQLNAVLAGIVEARSDALEPGIWQARAFAQYAVDVMRARDCPIDEDMIAGL